MVKERVSNVLQVRIMNVLTEENRPCSFHFIRKKIQEDFTTLANIYGLKYKGTLDKTLQGALGLY